MKGASFAAGARVAPALAQVALIVAQMPTAIGYGNASSIEAGKVVPLPGPTVSQPLALVTKGAPTPEAQRLIDAVREAAPKS